MKIPTNPNVLVMPTGSEPISIIKDVISTIESTILVMRASFHEKHGIMPKYLLLGFQEYHCLNEAARQKDPKMLSTSAITVYFSMECIPVPMKNYLAISVDFDTLLQQV